MLTMQLLLIGRKHPYISLRTRRGGRRRKKKEGIMCVFKKIVFLDFMEFSKYINRLLLLHKCSHWLLIIQFICVND